MISDIVKKTISDSKQSTIKFGDDFIFDHHLTIKRITHYINDRFLDLGDQDAIFWNISNERITHFSKNIDLDTKDFKTTGQGETNVFQNWVLSIRYRKWIRDSYFALILNELSDGVATFGSTIWKRTGSGKNIKLEQVSLRNVYFNTKIKELVTNDTINANPFVELHYLSESQLRPKKAWDNVEEALRKGVGQQEFEVWEYWGNNDKDEYVHQIGYGYGEDEVILFDDTVTEKDFPYYDFHIGQYRGRWLRVGIVERLFKLQERTNELVNQNAETTKIASLLLLRSQDPETVGNVLDGAVSGQIITSADLQQIGIDNRSLGAFIQEMQLISQKADKLCLTPEIVGGELAPSGTPFRSVAVSANAAKSTFRYIKESIGEKLGYIMLEDILPDIVKGWNRDELLEVAEDESDIEMFDSLATNQQVIELVLAGGVVDPMQVTQLAEEVKKFNDQNGRKIELEKGFFNFDYGLVMNVTGEATDKQQQNDAYFNALQMIQANPALGNNRLFRQYLENNGIPYWKLTKEEVNELQQSSQATGGGGQVIGKQDQTSAVVDSQ